MAAPEESIFSSYEDIAGYHSLLWLQARWHENAVGPLVRPSDIEPFVPEEARRRHLTGVARVAGDAALQGCLTSPGMGDQTASLVAQAYNQCVLLQGGALHESCWMSYSYPSPVGKLWVGSYIDDILVLMISVAGGAPA